MAYMAVCAWPGCPRLVPRGHHYCQQHQRDAWRKRDSSARRGYGRDFQHLRAQYAQRIAAGHTYICDLCGQPIRPGEPWDLGHSPDRAHITGPEHRACNRRDGQSRAAASREHYNNGNKQQPTNN